MYLTLDHQKAQEILRSIIDHKKVFVLALNGPGVGGGAAWFPGVADIVLAAEGAYLQVPFNALGLVPENGSSINISQSMGIHRANDFLMFGRKLTVEELENWGLVNRIFPKEGFHHHVVRFLKDQLAVNDGKSMIESKRLMNAPLRDGRLVAVVNAVDALAERCVEDAQKKRFEDKKKFLEGIRLIFVSTILTQSFFLGFKLTGHSQIKEQSLEAVIETFPKTAKRRNVTYCFQSFPSCHFLGFSSRIAPPPRSRT